ncbi:alanine racemase domain protein [Bifidobacterium actinocoloniiforme DSM 22766]|uniref:Pyridoxal phosphate homeostasis protein n=1 Tax=Bifidobacterium actinocoloniiforme DSM 22766 TaxID=1437605 RepID=A0A086Z282_9BIFI|nr:YggS family pyridoxal phosphate-dependent enzyme [Bifidobacterium actinocoloniiforme]AKV55653.1 enzyme with a TIM-barrel fold protein [Bifidobacterium actinocoloniiforme DSM 22766]KFI40632.1 alanine racemase domain protein [Bifidobacterium actinocoloniiforme DSM 22766]
MSAYMQHKDLSKEDLPTERGREIADGVHRVMERMAEAEAAAGRRPGDVRLLAATKTRDVGEIMAAIDAGVRLIGENRPQEVTAKFEGLTRQCAQRQLALGQRQGPGSVAGPSSCIGFHLIGQLQSNKINKILPCVDTVESVDSLELADKLGKRAQARGLSVGVLLEVNESGEAAKSGCSPDEAEELAYRIAGTEGLSLRGLMTIGAHVDDERTIRRGFAHLRGLRDRVRDSGEAGTDSCRELSMGMTGDMAYAIAEGSTIVRVGAAIFGKRAFI